MYEQELYHNFTISSSRSYFIAFAGDVSVQLQPTTSTAALLSHMKKWSSVAMFLPNIVALPGCRMRRSNCTNCMENKHFCHLAIFLFRRRRVRLVWILPVKKRPKDSEPRSTIYSTEDNAKLASYTVLRFSFYFRCFLYYANLDSLWRTLTTFC